MTYDVFRGTLNPTQSINQLINERVGHFEAKFQGEGVVQLGNIFWFLQN